MLACHKILHSARRTSLDQFFQAMKVSGSPRVKKGVARVSPCCSSRNGRQASQGPRHVLKAQTGY